MSTNYQDDGDAAIESTVRRKLDRGVYRSIYAALADDDDFQALSGDAVKTFLVLKLKLPETGIGVIYPGMLRDLVGCDDARLEEILQELESPKGTGNRGWIERQGRVVWLVNALRHSPHYLAGKLSQTQRKYFQRCVAELDPKLQIVARFRAEYREWFDETEDTDHERGAPGGRRSGARHTDRVSDRVSDTQAIPPSIQGRNKNEEEEVRKKNEGENSTTATAPALALVRSATPPSSDRPRGPLNFREVLRDVTALFDEVGERASRRRTREELRVRTAEVIFLYWCQRLSHKKALLDEERKAMLIKRLVENGDNADELLYVVDGALRDDWTMGRDERSTKPFDGIESIFRSRAKVEQLAELCPDYRAGKPHGWGDKLRSALTGAASETTDEQPPSARVEGAR